MLRLVNLTQPIIQTSRALHSGKTGFCLEAEKAFREAAFQ